MGGGGSAAASNLTGRARVFVRKRDVRWNNKKSNDFGVRK